MNPLAQELNETIQDINTHVYEMLSDMGRAFFFPKGILSQGAEAKIKADRINATIGIAKEKGAVMNLPSVAELIPGIDADSYLPYAPSYGIPELRDAWKEALFTKNPGLSGKSISRPVVTSGITHAISTFADLWVNPGDTIILPDMMWGNYNLTFGVRRQAGIVHYRTFDEDLQRLDIDSFEEAVRARAETGGKVIVLLNFPNNPSGYTPTRQEAERIAGILIDIAGGGTPVVAACDDAYFGLFYEEESCKESLFSLLAGADPRLVAVKLDGATKEDYVWGLRTGFITYGLAGRGDLAPLYEALEKKTAGCIRGTISNSSHLSQAVLLRAMAHERYAEYKQDKFDILMARAAEIRRVLAHPKYGDAWDVYPFNSGYFMCIRLKDVNAENLRVHLLDHYGTGLISIGEKNLRVAFSCLEVEDVQSLFDTILQGVKDLKQQ